MSDFINIADLVDPNDKDGRTWRQINNAEGHNIPIGTRVTTYNNMVLFVTQHTRDCDGTPLYSLGNPDGKNLTGGYSEGDISYA